MSRTTPRGRRRVILGPKRWMAAAIAGLAFALVALPARAVEAKLDVYVNPEEFDARVPRLAIGDPAPKLAVDRWVQGGPVAAFAPDTVYVLEFWATWCLPCRKSLPEMDALARRYAGRGLRVIGVAGAETGDAEGVARFLSAHPLSYPIAFRAAGDMYESWVRAARGSGLPWVFVVDRRGRIAWWGQPFYGAFDGVLDAVLADRWDMGSERSARSLRQVDEPRQWRLKLASQEAVQGHDFAAARKDLDTLVTRDPERWWWEVVLRVLVTRRGLNRPAEAHELAAQAIHGVSRNNPHALTALAGRLLQDDDPAFHDVRLALEAAERANQLTLGSDDDVRRVLESARAAQGGS